MTRAACYMRVSMEAQAEKWSLPAQRRVMTEYCRRNKWKPIMYEDAGISGETIAARPAMQRILRCARREGRNVVCRAGREAEGSQDVGELGGEAQSDRQVRGLSRHHAADHALAGREAPVRRSRSAENRTPREISNSSRLCRESRIERGSDRGFES